MNDNMKKAIRREASPYFSADTVDLFIKEISQWSGDSGRPFYQITQEGDQPLFVVGISKKATLINCVLRENQRVVSNLPFSKIVLTEFFRAPNRSTLRVHFTDISRPSPYYFQYTAFDEKEERRLNVFARILSAKLDRRAEE